MLVKKAYEYSFLHSYGQWKISALIFIQNDIFVQNEKNYTLFDHNLFQKSMF